MSDIETKALHDISTILGRMEALQEANMRSTTELTANVNRLVEKLDRSDDIAREALQRVKSAQHQLDDVRGDIKWLWRTVIGAILTGAIGGAIAFIWKGVGG